MRTAIRKPVQKKETVNLKPKSMPEFAKLMLKHFGIKNSNSFLDKALINVTGKIELDLIALDDYFHEKFGDYEDSKPEGVSMSEFITEKFGTSANNFVKIMIGKV